MRGGPGGALRGERVLCGLRGHPGTRAWNADLHLYCAAHPPQNCPPLACPEGPTRAICRDHACALTATGPDGGPTRVPVERRCLPAMVCSDWKGCAMVSGNGQDGWFVDEGAQVSRGALAGVRDNVCLVKGPCEGAVVAEPGVVCPPQTVPALIQPPPYSCVLREGRCDEVPNPPAPPSRPRSPARLIAARWSAC